MAVLETLWDDIDTVWEHVQAPRVKSIPTHADLRLFRLEEPTVPRGGSTEGWQIINFPAANLTNGFSNNCFPYDGYIDKILRVTIIATHGRCPKPYQRRIREIVEAACPKIAK